MLCQIQLLANKSGSSGRATWYWTDKSVIKTGQEYFDCYKVVISSAYPKKSIVSSTPTIENVKSRLKTLVEVLPPILHLDVVECLYLCLKAKTNVIIL